VSWRIAIGVLPTMVTMTAMHEDMHHDAQDKDDNEKHIVC
jgi:hypothetical protein